MVVRPVQGAKGKARLKVLRSILQACRLLDHPAGPKWHRLAGHLVALKYHRNHRPDHLVALKYHQGPLSDHLADPKYHQGPLLDHLAAPKCHLEGPLLDHLADPKCHPEGPLLDHLGGARLDHRLGGNKRMRKAEVAVD